jgi:dienelactone hydrolase
MISALFAAITCIASSSNYPSSKPSSIMIVSAFAVNRCYKRPLTSYTERYFTNQVADEEDDDDVLMDNNILSSPAPPQLSNFDMDDTDTELLTQSDVQSMTIPQLKQQLRLRGRKVSGTKSQLIKRLLGNSGGIGDIDGGDGDDRIEKERMTDGKLPRGYSKYDKSMRRKTKDSIDGGETGSGEEHTSKGYTTTKRGGVGIDASSSSSSSSSPPQVIVEAKAKGANIVDVTDFIEATEIGKDFRSSTSTNSDRNDGTEVQQPSTTPGDNEGGDTSDDDDANPSSSSTTEVWGEDARIVEDYEGRSVVVDGLSRTVIEYKGSGDAIVQAYVVASRDSLRNFLRGVVGGGGDDAAPASSSATTANKTPVYSSMEEEVYAIQRKRETESSRGLIRPDEVEGQEDASDSGKYYSTMERDYGDWGVYTPTGAQLSSAEVQGVLLLSDVYGPFTENTRALADKIAFECQPVVVLAPDLFRGRPWSLDTTTVYGESVERNGDGKTFEEWRAMHPERRVNVDIRAAAAVLRERYAVSSIAVWGTCYGGGRALEAAAGWYADGPSSYYEDALSERPPPPHVDPVAAVAWYPTRYDAKKLFGKTNEGFRTFESGKDRSVAVLAVFAEDDSLPGATPKDAMLLKECLEADGRVKDFMVKMFPEQQHGFAHAYLGERKTLSNGDTKQEGMDLFFGDNYGSSMEPLDMGGDAEVACLLSTAWMETYTRVFLPTAGTPVKFDADERWSTLEMDGYSQTKKGRRDVRAELEEAIAGFEDVDVDLRRMTQTASPMLDGPGSDEYEQIEEEREMLRQQILEKYNISEDDDEETFERKFQQAKEDGALNQLLLDAYMDGDAYW